MIRGKKETNRAVRAFRHIKKWRGSYGLIAGAGAGLAFGAKKTYEVFHNPNKARLKRIERRMKRRK